MIKLLFATLKSQSHTVLRKSSIFFILLAIPLIADNIFWLKDSSSGCKVGFTYFKNVVAIKFKGKCDDKKFAKDGDVEFTLKDGSTFVYSGELKDGLFDGMGDVTFSNGNIIAGIWEKGYPKDEITFIKDGKSYRCSASLDYNFDCEGAGSKFGKSREAAFARWSGDYAESVIEGIKDTLSSGSSSSNDSSNITNINVKFTGCEKWNGHCNYSLEADGEYDGMIFYYKDGDHINIDTIGVHKGKSVNGFLSHDRLWTVQCGDKYGISGIDYAIRLVSQCIYKGYY